MDGWKMAHRTDIECSESERAWSVRLKIGSSFSLGSSVVEGVWSFLLNPCLPHQVFLAACGISADGLVCVLGLPPTPWGPDHIRTSWSQSYHSHCPAVLRQLNYYYYFIFFLEKSVPKYFNTFLPVDKCSGFVFQGVHWEENCSSSHQLLLNRRWNSAWMFS